MNQLKSSFYILALPVLLLTGWLLWSSQSDSFFVPTGEQMAGAFADTWTWGRFQVDVFPSVGRLMVGIAGSILIGIIVGLLVGSIGWLRALLEPAMEFFRALPPVVLIPVLILLVGIGDDMKILVIILGAVWPILLNTIEGVRSIDEVLSDTTRTYGINSAARVKYLILPSALPQLMAGVRQSLSIALILMVISEMFASSAGLGYAIVQFQRSFAIPEMWAGIVVLGLLGVTMSFIFQIVERRLLKWYHGQRELENAA